MIKTKSIDALLLLALLSITTNITSGEIIESTTKSSSNASKIISLPLLNYGTLKQRRMLEMDLNEDEMDSYVQSITPNDRQNYRRTSLEVGGLYQGYGTHYVDLWVGSPPQRQTVIVDTGSGVTAFPCSSCTNCGEKYHASTYFIEADSSTFRKNTCGLCWDRGTCVNKGKDDEYCRIGVSYQEGSSWTAYEAEDQTYLGGPHHHPLNITKVGVEAGGGGEGNHLGSGVVDEDPNDASLFRFPLQFGCQTEITGLFKTQLADGIMGMYNQKGAFWQQMYDAKIITKKQFSLCFSRQAEADHDGTVAGVVTMGGTDTKLHKTPMVFADGYINGGTMHGLLFRKIYLMEAGHYKAVDATPENTKVLDISRGILYKGRVILDSGTTDTYFTREIGSIFIKAFEQMAGVRYEKLMKLTDEQFAAIPSLLIQLRGNDDNVEGHLNAEEADTTPGLARKLDLEYPNDVLVLVKPNELFESKGDGRYTPKIHFDSRHGTVLGANFMAGHDILFDIPEKKRIGFAPSNCDYSKIINGLHATSPPSVMRVSTDTETDNDNDSDSSSTMNMTEHKYINAIHHTQPSVSSNKSISEKKYVCGSHALCRYGVPLLFVVVIILFGFWAVYGRYVEDMEYQRVKTEILNDLSLDDDDELILWGREERIQLTNEIQMRDMKEIT